MKRAIIVCLTACTLAGCALVQDEYDRVSLEECRETPGSNARLECERQARDAIADRRRAQTKQN